MLEHILPQSQVNLNELHKVLTKYEGLRKKDKNTVPSTPEENAKAFLDIKGYT